MATEISKHQVNNDSGHTVFHTRTFAHGKPKTVTTRNSFFQDLLSSNTPTIDKSSSKRSPLSILITLEDLVKQEGKAQAKVTEKSQSEPQKKTRTFEASRNKKKAAKLSDCGTSANFAAHVGTIVDVLWTDKDLKGNKVGTRMVSWRGAEV